MKCRLVKLENLSGAKCSIYSIIQGNDELTSLDQFISENIISLKSETLDILQRLKTIGHKTGARAHFFKKYEGIPGDGVVALYDDPDKNLRLYCITYGTLIVIVGGGGPKPKDIKAFQEDEKLTKENYFLRELSAQITQRIKDGDITYTDDYKDFEGDLTFNDQEDEYL